MNLNDDANDVKSNNYQHRGVKEILNSLLQTPIGIHQIIVYPNNIKILRETYFYYIKKLLKDNNEIVIFLPYHESADSVKNTLLSSFLLTQNNNSNYRNNNNNNNDKEKQQQNIDIKRYINNGSLLIIDSYQIFSTTETRNQIDKDNKKFDILNINNNKYYNFSSLIRMSLSHAKKLKKDGITILADYGFIYKENGFEDLLELEKSIPHTFDNINIKQICLYNQNDFFHKFTKLQKKELLDLHSRSILMIDS